MTLATSHVSAARPKSSWLRSCSSSSSGTDPVQKRMQGQARRDGVHPYPVGGPLRRRGAGEGHDAGLGRRVVGLVGLGPPRRAPRRC